MTNIAAYLPWPTNLLTRKIQLQLLHQHGISQSPPRYELNLVLIGHQQCLQLKPSYESPHKMIILQICCTLMQSY